MRPFFGGKNMRFLSGKKVGKKSVNYFKTLIKCLLVLFILTRISLVCMFPKNPLRLELIFKGALRTCVPKPVKTRPLVYKYLFSSPGSCLPSPQI